MSSRKIEERNEKIIRGLMKLPPNRRCINCNSLGPQYVCTNFWTFVCITCSGIHREFTHRVKSVSMSTFTSQEIESLQNGGNQRARETFLNDWDPQRQRFPDSSNADKVREFIKHVYVDKKFAGRKTSDKPPRGMQDLKSVEDETRRASSYHSYSQSPPYDYEYEERRYGKQAFALTSKTGSDRGIKTCSFLSPSRSSDNVREDRFVAEGSHSRASSYSVSSAGDTFRSDTQSPTFQRGIGFSSPFNETSMDILSEDARQHHKVNTYSDTYAKRDTDQVPHSQRTASTSSFGSFNSNSMSFKSVSSENAADVPLEADQSAGTRNNHLATFLSLPHSSSGNADNLDLFNSPFVSQTVTSSASAPDLFQLPTTSSKSAVDLFQPSSLSSLPTLNSHVPSQNFQPSGLDLFSDMPQQQLAPTLDENSSDVAIQKNEGWATFDAPQYNEPTQVVQNSIPATMPSNEGGSLKNFDEHLFPETVPQWASFPYSSSHAHHSSIPDQWHESLHNIPAILNAGTSQPWSAFENPVGQLPFESVYLQSTEQVTMQNPSSIEDQYLGLLVSEDLNKDGIQIASTDNGLPIFSSQSHEGVSSSVFPFTSNTAGALSHSTDIKSTNPFDTPYDADLESSNAFLDMSSLQAVLPNGQMHTTFIGGVTEPWFTQNPVTHYIPAGPGPQGGLGLLGGPTPNTQITTVPSQGPVATVGGNPFA